MRLFHPVSAGRILLQAPGRPAPAPAPSTPAVSDLSGEQVSRLLWAARRSPALFVATEHGFFAYEAAGHALVPHTELDVRRALRLACGGSEALSRAPAVFVFATAAPSHPRGAECEKAVRAAEGAARDLGREAAALGLRVASCAAFDATRVSDTLALPADQVPSSIVPVLPGR